MHTRAESNLFDRYPLPIVYKGLDRANERIGIRRRRHIFSSSFFARRRRRVR